MPRKITKLLFAAALLSPIHTSTPQNPIPTDTTTPIEPPFGLEWGESPENVLNWIQTNQFTKTEGTLKDGRHLIEVDGPFPNAEFHRLRFYFSNSQLTETEIQFILSGEHDSEFSAITKTLAVKNLIDQKMGKGYLIKNQKGREGNTNWQFIQQIWTDEEHSIWLALFSANHQEKGNLSIISLHHRWEKKLKENLKENSPEKTPKKP